MKRIVYRSYTFPKKTNNIYILSLHIVSHGIVSLGCVPVSEVTAARITCVCVCVCVCVSVCFCVCARARACVCVGAQVENRITHQLDEGEAAVAMGHDEDILGCSFGHKVVPYILHMFLW